LIWQLITFSFIFSGGRALGLLLELCDAPGPVRIEDGGALGVVVVLGQVVRRALAQVLHLISRAVLRPITQIG
jgi:hypothetical protein